METTAPDELAHRRDSTRVFDIRKAPDDRRIPGSIRIDGSALEAGNNLPFDKDEAIVLYCSGNSCSRIAKALRGWLPRRWVRAQTDGRILSELAPRM